MDEVQLEVDESEVKIKSFKTKEEAEAFKATYEAKSNTFLSNVRELDGKWIVAKCKAGDLAVKSILKGGEFYNYNVPLTSGWDLGKNWADCH